MLRITTANLRDIYDPDRPDEERWARVEAMLDTIQPDVLAVQELIAREPDKRDGAADALRKLGSALGMSCEVDGEPVVAVGGGIHHVAVLWRSDRISAVPGTVQRLERSPAGMWHSCVAVDLDVNGHAIRIGSTHLSPFDGLSRAQDARQVHRAMARTAGPCGLVGGDWNSLSSDVQFDPDPYAPAIEAGRTWDPDWAYQYRADGELDRDAARWLEGPGGMRDCVMLAGGDWAPTVGHVPDAHPPRRIDRWLATPAMPAAAITDVQVAPLDLVGDASDHRPVVVTVDEARLP
ncbi:endonuclease/exonuclease/phosphatase family metal-dependent hydrolase [Prauserella sediminis]|uniref:Endonuclease/exonuclease/phosphatase family metal-dependent hydrolase n=1 Tax=Prauserella sediminis TaxID=577680 RepID=A0A839XQ20_9PSEU|nr:endonuclease/exonuclease/phosphatase family protein [Prauserella sediminis]MBB3665922.1 endonuclease/exonuclease/phosphatase family metal-dependent hydrolase [Prauserella sediminis]